MLLLNLWRLSTGSMGSFQWVWSRHPRTGPCPNVFSSDNFTLWVPSSKFCSLWWFVSDTYFSALLLFPNSLVFELYYLPDFGFPHANTRDCGKQETLAKIPSTSNITNRWRYFWALEFSPITSYSPSWTTTSKLGFEVIMAVYRIYFRHSIRLTLYRQFFSLTRILILRPTYTIIPRYSQFTKYKSNTNFCHQPHQLLQSTPSSDNLLWTRFVHTSPSPIFET